MSQPLWDLCPTQSCVLDQGHLGSCANSEGRLLTGRTLKYGPSGKQYQSAFPPPPKVERPPSLPVAIYRLWRERRRAKREVWNF